MAFTSAICIRVDNGVLLRVVENTKSEVYKNVYGANRRGMIPQ